MLDFKCLSLAVNRGQWTLHGPSVKWGVAGCWRWTSVRSCRTHTHPQPSRFTRRCPAAVGAERRLPSARCGSWGPAWVCRSFSGPRTSSAPGVCRTGRCCSGSPPASPGSNIRLLRWAEGDHSWRFVLLERQWIRLQASEYSPSRTVVPRHSWPNTERPLCLWSPRHPCQQL